MGCYLEPSGDPSARMLDTFFRKYAWIVNAVLLVAAAWLCARTVNTVVAAAIRPRPHVDLSALPASAPAPAAHAPLAVERLYPLFGLSPPPRPEEVAAKAPPPPPQNCTDRRAAPVKSGLHGQLVAVVMAERPEWSIATIVDTTTREGRIYGVGDHFQTATLLSVDRIRDPHDTTGGGFQLAVILCNAGRKEYLDFESGEGVAAAAPPPGQYQFLPQGAGAGTDLSGVRKVADNRYDIQKRVLDQSLANLNNLATQARIVPSFKNGVANGFKLFSIQPGSLYSAIGIENGDVIQRINGYEINSPDKALEIYTKLREANHVTVELERNGQPIKKDYNITGP